MDPTTVCCPHLACPARGQTGQGTLGSHARQEPRCICHACDTTVSATTGPVFSRLLPAADPVITLVTVLAQGCPGHAMVAACGCDERTVAAWWARSGRQGQAVHAYLGEPPRDWGQVQADERRVKPPGGSVWMALAMLVKTRLGLGGEGSAPRALPLLRRLIARGRRGAVPRPLWVCPDGVVSSIRAMRETCRAPGHTGQGGRPRLHPWRQVWSAQGLKRDERRRGVATDRRRGAGAPARVETRRRRAPGGGVINTADSARLHATFRERLAPLARRGRGLARHTLTRRHGLSLSGTVSNFCTPPASLAHADRGTTPAMAAGITEHGWSVRAWLSLPVPPPRWTPPAQRGRPSHALKRLMARWCADHG